MNKYIVRIAFVAVVLLVISFSGYSVVGTGEAGMKVRWGEVVSEKPLQEGIYLYNPITTSVVAYDCKNTTYSLRTDLYTKDNQPVTFAISVTYHLNREKVIDLHKTTGRDFEAKLVKPNVQGCLKDIVGQIETDHIVTQRASIADKLRTDTTRLLSSYGIEVVFVNLDNIDYDDAYEAAIKQKQVALQNSQKEKNETARIEESAKQDVIKAEAAAKSRIALAESEAKAITLKAEAEAKAIKLKNDALANSQRLVDLVRAERWDGKLPTTMFGGNMVPFVNMCAAPETVK